MENNWKLRTIIVAVKDMDKAVEHYQSLGIGPFSPESILDRRTLYTDLKVSRPGDMTAKLKHRTAQLDSVRFELIQPVEEESFQKEFLDSRGEGVVDLSFIVDDLEEETAKLVEKGIPVILSATRESGSIAIFDTRKVGNFYIQLVQLGQPAK